MLWRDASYAETILTIALTEQARVHRKAINKYLAARDPYSWSLHTGRLKA